jgi:hypothetical protein
MGREGGRGCGLGSDIITPTRHVMMPVTKRAPPPMNTGRTLAQANTFPDRIVRRQELAAAATRTGPSTTMIIPRMKISDLNLSRSPSEGFASPGRRDGKGGFLRLCYSSLYSKNGPGCSVERKLSRQSSEGRVSRLLGCGRWLGRLITLRVHRMLTHRWPYSIAKGRDVARSSRIPFRLRDSSTGRIA